MNTLAIDIGTNTGFSVSKAGDPIFSFSGTWLLAEPKELQEAKKLGLERRRDIRFVKLHSLICDTLDEFNIERIVFEDVLFQSSQAQTQLWSRLTGALWAASLTAPCEIEVQAVPVNTLKLFATGYGGADKSMMAEALKKKYPNYFELLVVPNPDHNPKKVRSPKHINVLRKISTGKIMDDNEVDAIWLSEFANAVDGGTQTFTSIWEKKKAAAKLKREKLKLAKQKKQVLSEKSK